MLIACEKVPIIDKIIDNLYLGDYVASNNEKLLKVKEITVVISMIKTVPKGNYDNIDYYSFPVEDNRNENISIYFEDTNLLISKFIKNKNILVHCENGVSRSVTIILAYLMKIEKMNLRNGLYLIKNNRTSTFTRPNSGFAKQLLKYEKSIYEKNSISLSEILKC